jgi:hypothetical protein
MLYSAMTKGLKGDRSMQQFFLRGSYNPLESGPEDEEEEEKVKVAFRVLWPRINAHGGSVRFLMSKEDADRLPDTIYVNLHARDAALADIDGRAEELPEDIGELLLSPEEQDHQNTVKGGDALNKGPSNA